MSVTAVPIRPLSRGAVLKLWIGLLLLLLAAAGLAWWSTARHQVVTLDSGVRYRTLREGTGPTITPADLFALRYELKVGGEEGQVIQSSDAMGQPFVASTQQIYPGFAEAIQHMREGGSYLLWLPPGQHEQGTAPPGAPFSAQDTLFFEVQVLQVAPGMAAMQQLMGPPPGAAPPGAPGGETETTRPEGAPRGEPVEPQLPAGEAPVGNAQ